DPARYPQEFDVPHAHALSGEPGCIGRGLSAGALRCRRDLPERSARRCTVDFAGRDRGMGLREQPGAVRSGGRGFAGRAGGDDHARPHARGEHGRHGRAGGAELPFQRWPDGHRAHERDRRL
ncbi:MAG: hypothetical protein AVDCRST_MAG71-1159, partial [uncultured Lysobacter sp.]